MAKGEFPTAPELRGKPFVARRPESGIVDVSHPFTRPFPERPHTSTIQPQTVLQAGEAQQSVSPQTADQTHAQ